MVTVRSCSSICHEAGNPRPSLLAQKLSRAPWWSRWPNATCFTTRPDPPPHLPCFAKISISGDACWCAEGDAAGRIDLRNGLQTETWVELMMRTFYRDV